MELGQDIDRAKWFAEYRRELSAVFDCGTCERGPVDYSELSDEALLAKCMGTERCPTCGRP